MNKIPKEIVCQNCKTLLSYKEICECEDRISEGTILTMGKDYSFLQEEIKTDDGNKEDK